MKFMDPAGVRLAGLMHDGLSFVDVAESQDHFIEHVGSHFLVCALGAALVGMYSGAQEALDAVEFECIKGYRSDVIPSYYLPIATRILNVDAKLAAEIDRLHLLGMSIASISEKLRVEGVEIRT